jgi:hypothetical protein
MQDVTLLRGHFRTAVVRLHFFLEPFFRGGCSCVHCPFREDYCISSVHLQQLGLVAISFRANPRPGILISCYVLIGTAVFLQR